MRHQKLVAAAISILVLALILSACSDEPSVAVKEVVKDVEVPVEKIVTVEVVKHVEVPVEKIVTKTVEVPKVVTKTVEVEIIKEVPVQVEVIKGRRVRAIRDRGKVVCASHNSVPGFGFQDDAGNTVGFDIDLCRALAVAVLGDANAVELWPITAAERGPSMLSG